MLNPGYSFLISDSNKQKQPSRESGIHMNKSKQTTMKITHLGAIVALALLIASPQSSRAKTAITGPLLDFKGEIESNLVPNGGFGTVINKYVLYYGLAPVMPIRVYAFPINPPLLPGQYWAYSNLFDHITWGVGGSGLTNSPDRIIGVAFPTYDDTDPEADIHLMTIYGPDLNPDGPILSMGGFNAAEPEISFQDEQFIAPDGTTYLAGPAQVVAIQDVFQYLTPGADLSFLQGNPDDVVYVFDTDVPAADFGSLAVLNSSFALGAAFSAEGGFGVDLPLTNTPATGVEPRSGGRRGNYTVGFHFNNSVASVASVTTTCGTVVSEQIDLTDSHLFLVNLSAPACNAQDLTVILTGIVDDQGNVLDSAPATVGLLIGDTDGDRTVTRGDFSLVKTVLGQITDGTNFREDVNANGTIDNNDGKLVKQHLGATLP
jgi:hypothetical protein